VSSVAVTQTRRSALVAGDLLKLGAFLRRDALVAWSYRASLLSEWFTLGLQAVIFYFVGRMVDPSTLPAYGGSRASYMEFAAVGIALGAFLQLALGRVAQGIRSEQMMGTLESLMMTPTSPATVQVGTVIYDLVYIPIRTAAFLAVVAVAFGLHFHADGFLPALLVLVAFVPFAWGLGVISAAAVTTFKRGHGVAGIVIGALTLVSGAYIPLSVFPHWVERLTGANPITLAVEGMRRPLLAGGWTGVGHAIALLTPVSAITLTVGIGLFRLALRREHRRGTLGTY
jgi:ABC-2 type transport system permease protein